MQTEIYDEREIDSATLTKECDKEALDLIAELGLKAQRESSGARLAYPQPTGEQGFVINALFPTGTLVENYDAGSIPLRVLKEIRSYRTENPNHVLVVRHSPPAQVKDPVLMAYIDKAHPWIATQEVINNWKEFRLIARWGDALESWDVLMERATALMTKRADEALTTIIAHAESMRASFARGVKYRSATMPTLDLPRL